MISLIRKIITLPCVVFVVLLSLVQSELIVLILIAGLFVALFMR